MNKDDKQLTIFVISDSIGETGELIAKVQLDNLSQKIMKLLDILITTALNKLSQFSKKLQKFKIV